MNYLEVNLEQLLSVVNGSFFCTPGQLADILCHMTGDEELPNSLYKDAARWAREIIFERFEEFKLFDQDERLHTAEVWSIVGRNHDKFDKKYVVKNCHKQWREFCVQNGKNILTQEG